MSINFLYRDKRKIHFKTLGCDLSRKDDTRTSTNISYVDCKFCLKIIKEFYLMPRNFYPQIPTFPGEYEPGKPGTFFRCPVCGNINYHFRGSGYKKQRNSLCRCWQDGYCLTLSLNAEKELYEVNKRWLPDKKGIEPPAKGNVEFFYDKIVDPDEELNQPEDIQPLPGGDQKKKPGQGKE